MGFLLELHALTLVARSYALLLQPYVPYNFSGLIYTPLPHQLNLTG